MRKTKERNEPRFCADSSHWCRKGHHTPSCHPPVVVVAWTLVATSQLLHWSVPEGPAFCQPHTTKFLSINPSTTLHLQSTYLLTCSTPFPIDFPTHPSFFLFSFFLSTAGFVLSESHGPDLTWPFVMRGRPRKCHQLAYQERFPSLPFLQTTSPELQHLDVKWFEFTGIRVPIMASFTVHCCFRSWKLPRQTEKGV